MIKNMRVLMLFCLIVAVNVRPISPEKAWFGAGATGAVVAGAIAAGTTSLFPKSSTNTLFKFALGLPVSVFIGYLIFNGHTAAGRIETAERMLNAYKDHCLATQCFASQEQLESVIYNKYFAHSWPLISAFNDCISHMCQYGHVINVAELALKEDSSLQERVDKIKATAYSCFKNMDAAIAMIRRHKDYSCQLGQFKVCSSAVYNDSVATYQSKGCAKLRQDIVEHTAGE